MSSTGNGYRIVVALGGNAISRPEQEGNVAEQFENSRLTARALSGLVEEGYHLVITHGNGPQIGNFLLRNEVASGTIYRLPMEVAVAHVQGGMGFMIAQTLTSELRRRGDNRTVSAVITTVLVDADDPSFAHPTKPIGRRYTKEEADRYQATAGWHSQEVSPGAWRRVVASPKPLRIMEIETIRKLVEARELIVACGGGGIPVTTNGDGNLRGVKAIIDKDLASALLASQLDADRMMILTNVDRVAIRHGKPDEQPLETLTLAEARRLMKRGEFPAGSMGPKVQGAINFLEASHRADAEVIIGPLDRARDAIAGRTGTRITR